MREMQALVQNYVLNRDRQMKYLAVLIALSLFVSFMVPFILMQPADSMAEASVCEIEEHVHTVEAGCYQLFCVPEGEEEHVHTDLCYGLICEKIVHTHTPNCHPSQPDFSALFSAVYDPNNLKATANGTNYANSPKDKPSEYQAPPGSLLGVATHFHIFAESVALRSHVHGNIATNYLLENGAFGVYNDRLNGMSSINYIRNLGPNASLDNAYQTQLIMGHNYSSPPSPWFVNRYEIRDKKNHKTYYIPKDKFPAWGADGYVEPQLKFEKPDRPYINITQELNKFANMSMELVDSAKTANYQSIISDQNGNFSGNKYEAGKVTVTNQGENLILDFSQIDDKYIYYTIDATDFGMNAPWSTWMKVLQIKGITEDKFLFLNVDVGTNPNAYFSKSWMVYQNDNQNDTYGTGEVTLGEGGTRVIYNIVSSDGNGGNYKPFEGDAVFGERRNGSILAPNADVNVAGNTNGTIIARNFVATGESHRCDVQQEGTEGDDSDWTLEVQEPTTEAPKPSEPAKKLHIDVEKKWSGGTVNQDITIRLYKSFEPNLNVNTATLTDTGKTVTLNSGNSWKAKFSDLPAYENDKTVYYYVKETTAVDKYTASYDKNGISVDPGKVIVTNTKEKEIAVTVKKVWNPETIAPTATQEPRTYKIMPIGDSLTEGYSERLQWGNHGYRKYLDYFLKDKAYEIDMVGPKGTDTNTATFPLGTGEITYTYDNKHAGYSGYRIDGVLDELVNANAVKEAQPDIVLLTIGTNNVNGGDKIADCEEDLHELLDHILTNLPSDSVIFLTSIPEFCHNWYPNEYVDVTEYNDMVKRVADYYANSLKNVIFVDENKWVTLDDLVHATNDWIHPTDSGYEKIGRAWAEVIDSYIQDTKAIESVPAEVRNPITVKLYKSTNGNLNAANASDVNQMEYVTTAELNSENGWTCKFDSLPAMSGNQLLYYYAVEENVPDHYTVTYQNNAVNSNDGTIIATNTKEKLMNITLDKTWVGEKPQNEQVTVELYQSTERNLDMSVSDAEITQLVNQGKVKKLSEVKLTAGENPHFTNLPIYQADGKTMYYYYVREKDFAGYKASYSKNPNYGGDKQVTITNTKLISVEATKDWQFENNTTLQHMANTEITVELYKYKHVPVEGEMYYIPTTFIPLGAEYLKSMTLKGDNSKATFDNLPIEEDGYKLFYYVREVPQDAITKDFDVIYGTDNNGQLVDPNVTATLGKTIINKEKASTEISITINKNWDVSDFFNDLNGNGLFEPPNEYYVQDSVNPVEKWADPIKVTLQYSTDGTNWQDYTAYKDVELYTTYTFTNLPKQIGGQNVYYKVVETYNYGYVTDYGTNNNVNASSIQKGQATPEITLKNTILKRTLNVKKNWYNNINDGVDKVVVEIYRRTTNKKPDLGINPDGTYVPETPGGTDGIIINSFDDGTAQGWTQDGAHERGDGSKSGLQTSVTYDESEYSYGLVSNGSYGSTADGKGYCAVIQKTFTTAEMVPGQTYTISAKATRNSTTPVYMALLVKNGDTLTEIARTPAIDESGVWETATCNYTVPANATGTTLVIAPVTGDGHMGTMMYVDDIKIELVSTGGGTTPEQPVDPNDLIHDTFESGTDGWYAVGSDIRTSSDQKFVGSSSLEVYSRDATWAGAQKTLDPDVFIPGNTYSFSVNACYAADPDNTAEGASSEAAASNDIKLTLVYKDAEGNDHYDQINLINTAGAGNWIKLENTGFKIPDGATDIQVKVEIPTSLDKIYIDEFIARLVSTGSGGNTNNDEILNSTFDSGDDGWKLVGTHSNNGDQKSSLKNNAYEIYLLGLIEYTNSDVLSRLTAGNTYSLSVTNDRANMSKMVITYNDGTATVIDGVSSGEFTVPAGKTVSSIKIGVDAFETDTGIYTPMHVDNIVLRHVSTSGSTNTGSVNTTWSFEDQNNLGWVGYRTSNDNSPAYTTKSGVPGADGNAWLEFTVTGTDMGAKANQYNLIPGQTYNFSAAVSRSESENANIQFKIVDAANGETLATITGTAEQRAWPTVSGSFVAKSNGVIIYFTVPGAPTGDNKGTVAIDKVNINGPNPATYSKPRNVETFFTDSETLTKRQLNVQKIESVKFAKASTACKDYWYDTEITYSEDNNKAPTIIDFDTFTRNGNTFVGDTVKHLEVQLYGQVAFPSEINVWLQGTGDFGGSNWKTSNNANGIVHTFAKNLTIKEKTYLRVFTTKPELVKRLVLTFTNGTTLTINNTKDIADAARVESNVEAPAVNGTHSKDIAYLDGGDWKNVWDIWSSGEELNQIWANQTINSADVYFAKDYGVDYNNLNTDNEAIKANQGSANVSKFGMYLLINGEINSDGRNWNGHEVYAALNSDSVKTGDDYVVANYNFTNSPKLSSDASNNISSLIIKTGDKLKVKAVVLKCDNGQSYVINNTEYSHVAGVTTDTRYYEFVQEFNYNSSSDGDSISQRWPNNNEKLDEIEVYFKKGVVNSSTLSSNLTFYNPGNVNGTFDVSDAVYDIARYSYTNNNISKDQISQTINGKTSVPNAIKMIVLTSNWGSKFVIVNTAYAENNDYNTTADQFEKWYPFTYSGAASDTSRINNVFLTIDDLGRDFNGKKIKSMQMYINAKVTKDKTPGQIDTNTYLQDNQIDFDGKLTCVSKNETTSKEKCQTVSGAYGICNVFNYEIVSTYDGIADATFHGADETDKWTGDRLNIQTANPTDISRVVLTFDDGTTYTVWNMNYLGTEDGVLHYSHKTSFSANRDTKNNISKDLLADSDLIDRYEGRKLDYIVVTYGEDGDEFTSIPMEKLNYDGNTSNPSIGDISITHTFTNQIENPGVLKIIEDASDNFTLADIKEVKLFYKDSDTNVDGENSTYTIYNTDYSPKAPADTPAIGNQPALGSDFVFISTLDLTKENGWKAALEGLPVTDGQGNAYEYVIVEKNVYGEGADRYQLVSYEHPDGVILDEDGKQTSFLNTTTDEENGLVIMPSSGGEGKTWFYVAGVALMLCGIAGCYGMKRWQRSRR